jgi:hypothetical protein
LAPIAVTPAGISEQLSKLAVPAAIVPALVLQLPAEPKTAGPRQDATIWADAILTAVIGYQRNLALLAPWAAHLVPGIRLAPALAALVDPMPALSELPSLCRAALAILASQPAEGDTGVLIDSFQQSARASTDLCSRLLGLSGNARKLFDDMKFGFLFDKQRELLSIGYRVADGSLEPNYYDLLASEARLASFVGIAKGDLPTRHWFRLGRTMIPVGYGAVLTSWSGSMFEYLMPSLVMRAPNGSLLEQSNREVVRQQMKYGVDRHVPWGASESAYNARDLEFTYQYSSFGIPNLGLKRGVGDSTVIAPYATGLAAMIDPGAAVANFARLTDAGGRGRYGWYEALDYTPARVPEGTNVAVVHAYMAHHHGMTLVAIADALNDGAMRRRFHAERIVASGAYAA